MRPDGSYCIVVSRRQQRQNWLSAGAAKRLTLTIRLYNPSDAIIRDLADISLPSIQRRLSEAA